MSAGQRAALRPSAPHSCCSYSDSGRRFEYRDARTFCRRSFRPSRSAYYTDCADWQSWQPVRGYRCIRRSVRSCCSSASALPLSQRNYCRISIILSHSEQKVKLRANFLHTDGQPPSSRRNIVKNPGKFFRYSIAFSRIVWYNIFVMRICVSEFIRFLWRVAETFLCTARHECFSRLNKNSRRKPKWI